MPNLELQSRSLSQLYVFYERLKDDGYMNLYGYVNKALEVQRGQLSNISNSAAIIRNMAIQEARKEQSLLNKIFNTNITIDLNDNSSLKEFIDTLNSCLGLKEVYERNIYLIKNSKGAKSVISFFPTYFLRVWNESWPTIVSDIEDKIGNLRKREIILDIVEKTVDQYMPDIINRAIEEMFRAETELNSAPEEQKDAYLSLISAIGKVQQQGSLANQISNIYKLNEISSYISSSLEGQSRKFIKQNLQKIKVNDMVNKEFAAKGGLTLEAIENTVFQMVGENIRRVNGVTTNITATGALGVKADNIMTFNIDPEILDEMLQTNEKITRERNIKMFEELGKRLKNIQDGYIVYSSDKNYTYNEGFYNRGGFSGESINLETYKNIMSSVNKNIQTFIGTILQTTRGAVGDTSLRTSLESVIAQDVAYLLFDDFKTIGKEVDAGDPQSIHIMDLNGILIPLSFFLTLFARAIEDSSKNPKDLVKASIRNTSILFKNQKEQNDWQAENTQNAWDYQRERALEETRIEIHFLRDFQNIISSYL